MITRFSLVDRFSKRNSFEAGFDAQLLPPEFLYWSATPPLFPFFFEQIYTRNTAAFVTKTLLSLPPPSSLFFLTPKRMRRMLFLRRELRREFAIDFPFPSTFTLSMYIRKILLLPRKKILLNAEADPALPRWVGRKVSLSTPI